jgi:hypothetical protein
LRPLQISTSSPPSSPPNVGSTLFYFLFQFLFSLNCMGLSSPLACLPRRRAVRRPLPLRLSASTLPPLPPVSAPLSPSLPLRPSLFLPSARRPVPCLAHADPLATSGALTPEARHRGGAGR